MKPEEIALEIVKSALENGYVQRYADNTESANKTAEFFKTVYNSVLETIGTGD